MRRIRTIDWRPADAWTAPADGVLDLWRLALVPREGDRDLLTDEERARADRLIIPSKRDQFIAGRASLRTMLARYLGCGPKDLSFEYGEHGKPFLAGVPELAFNLSHSHELGILVVDPDPSGGLIGIDIEWHKPERALVEIAKRFFSQYERALLGGAEAAAVDGLFYRAWAQKEAYLKAWGTGLSFPSTGFTIEMDPDRPPRVVETTMPGDEDPARWCVEDLEVAEGYATALCYEGPSRPLRGWDR